MKTQVILFVLLSSQMFLAMAQNNTTVNNTGNTFYYGSNCESEVGNSPDVCEEYDSDYCCLYSKSTYGGAVEEAYTCDMNPGKLSDADQELADLAQEVADALGVEYEYYCAGGQMLKAAIMVAGIVAAIL
mmetsp:Transcript_27624/g.20733  ORF Transcript_27624/g.20733 Transcript_27624/m.20733 type:complete len:130 (+) Transcript_27624:45-434(+)|eukprot:CAMPEP_0202958866 /NCGR_PEP_ID=MMETSP1396-20130829/3140_1 /ASSEMBLY_ACC=CAM_ASM_000872 /TAXON_ID= /ORGANISM="Pseudokeronopsis sp., Strain Brazil" /LENGTH=129 /DNA_ID=CAMNT_0049677161 /DNA_START=61 /DNA_END=450 /DNA_ORIENTATION=-